MNPILSVVLPVYNESAVIPGVLRELAAVLDAHWPGQWEVLAVDDGSSDDTSDGILRVTKEFPGIRLLRLAGNVGQSGALWMGIRHARAEWVATLDADGQNDPADLPALMAARADADAVFGFRAKRMDTRSKRWGSKLANGVRNAILHENITDTGCAIKVFRRSLFDRLSPWNGMHRFLGSLFLMQQACIVQIAVNHRPRAAGQSKYTNWGRLKKTIRDLFAVRWMRSRYCHVLLAAEPDGNRA